MRPAGSMASLSPSFPGLTITEACSASETPKATSLSSPPTMWPMGCSTPESSPGPPSGVANTLGNGSALGCSSLSPPPCSRAPGFFRSSGNSALPGQLRAACGNRGDGVTAGGRGAEEIGNHSEGGRLYRYGPGEWGFRTLLIPGRTNPCQLCDLGKSLTCSGP